MALKPKLSNLPRIRSALRLYRVTSIVTGVFLLLLVLMMATRYGPLAWGGIGLDIELNGPEGFLALTPKEMISGINISTIILILHGWFYVVYLYSDFRLWSLMRWTFPKFILIALGGVIPFLSFIVERRVHRQTVAEIETLQASAHSVRSTQNEETTPLAK
jgi:integral membrane protein